MGCNHTRYAAISRPASSYMARKKSVSQYAKRCLVGGDVVRTHLHQQGVIRLRWQHTAAKMEEDNR